MNQQQLPNATIVLVLGIISIATCCCYGVPGIICGIIGLILFKKDNALFKENPQGYSNYSNLKIGRILCIIGIVFSILFLLYIIFIVSVIGIEALGDQDLMQQRIQELLGQ